MSRIQDKKTSNQNNTITIFAGIDVSKAQLDVHLYPIHREKSFPNSKIGCQQLYRWLKQFSPQLSVVEATGKYHRAVQRYLHQAGFAIAVVNPYRTRKFAQALGELAKTDKIDARVLAQFAAMMQPEQTPPPSLFVEHLRELVQERQRIIDEQTTLKLRLSQATHSLIIRQIKSRLSHAKRHCKKIDTAIREAIRSCEVIAHRFDILCSIPGVGFVTAITLIAELPELGHANSNQIAALAGVAPMNRDSGLWRGKRSIIGGRQKVRNALYMAALVATRKCNSQFAGFYKKLIARGKPFKVALTAVMRKLIILANTLTHQNRSWVPICP